ncbi:hypothetical protein JCM11641_005067 [Rhodosporidiobolus odoratus]
MSVPPNIVATPDFNTGPRHPNDAAPGRISKGGSLLTGGYLAHKVYVGNLPDSATLADLEDCFGQIGPCTCQIKRGFGFVEYEDPGHAAEAVAKYNDGHFLGSQIKVELSLARAPGGKNAHQDIPRERNPPGSDRPSDARKPMWINGGPSESGGGYQQRGPPRGRNNGPPDFARGFSGPPPGYGGYGGRYEDRPPPIDRPGYGPPPPRGEFDRYGPPRGGDFRGPPGYGPPVERPPFDPYYGDRGAPYPYAPPPPGAAPGYPPVAAPYDRPPYPAAIPAPVPGAPPPVRDPYADRYPPTGRSPVVAPPLDPYARSGPPAPLDGPASSAYDPRDERGAGARYYGGGGRSPSRGPPNHERRRSLSPRRGGPGDSYRDSFPPPSNGYPPYDSRAVPPPSGGYGGPPPPFDRAPGGPGGRSPPRYPPVDEYNPRR